MNKRLILFLLLATAWVGCGGDDKAKVSDVRVVHLVLGEASFNIQVGSETFTNVGFAQSASYRQIDSGSNSVNVNRGANVVVSQMLTFEEASSYTVAIYGDSVNGEPIALLPIVDATKPIPEGSIALQVFHAAPDVDTFDAYVGLTQGTSSEPFQMGVAYGTPPLSKSLRAGAYSLRIDTNKDKSIDYIFELPAFVAGEYVNVYLLNEGARPFVLLQRSDSSEIVRINHVPT